MTEKHNSLFFNILTLNFNASLSIAIYMYAVVSPYHENYFKRKPNKMERRLLFQTEECDLCTHLSIDNVLVFWEICPCTRYTKTSLFYFLSILFCSSHVVWRQNLWSWYNRRSVRNSNGKGTLLKNPSIRWDSASFSFIVVVVVVIIIIFVFCFFVFLFFLIKQWYNLYSILIKKTYVQCFT